MVCDKKHVFGSLAQGGDARKVYLNVMCQEDLPDTRQQGGLI